MRFSVAEDKIVVIGGSAGSLPPLTALLEGLPSRFGAVIIIVLHRQRNVPSNLNLLLAKHAPVPVKEPEDKEPLLPGSIYLAPQNYHLLLEAEGNFALEYSEPVRYSRPSIDVTLQSIAAAGANHILGILLSGANSDGAEGLHAVADRGGEVLVQAPSTAQFPAMPSEALEATTTARPLPVAGISEHLKQFV